MYRFVIYSFFLSIFCLMPSAQFQASEYPSNKSSGSILGSVNDFKTEFPIDGAFITAINEETGSKYTGIAAEDGAFFISPLPPGWYTISVFGTGSNENVISGYPVRIPDITSEPVQINLAKIDAGKLQKAATPSPPKTILRENTRKTRPPLEAHLHWNASVNTAAENASALKQGRSPDVFTLIELRQIPGATPRQRAPELSPQHLLIVIVDENGDQSGWALVPDPRIIRVDNADPTGELSGQTIYLPRADFHVTLPEGPASAGLKIYQPRWAGAEYALRLLGTISLP